MNLNYFYNKKNIFSLIMALIPLSFLLGNLAININIILLLSAYLFFFKKINVDFKIHTIDKIILFFFFYTLLVLILNVGENLLFVKWQNNTQLIENNFFFIDDDYFKNFNIYITFKTLFFLRFLILYIILRSLIDKDLINFNFFIITSLLICLFVVFDIFFQFIFNKDIFGIVPVHPRKLSGIFGEELIAGAFIQRFSLFLLFGFLYFYPNSKIKKFYFFLIVLFIFLAIIFSGNRFPLILFFLTLVLIAFFKKKLTSFIIIFLFIFIATFKITLKNQEIKENFINFKSEITEIYQSFKISNHETKIISSSYYHEFSSAYETWKLNKFFGGGLRSFRIICNYTEKQYQIGPHVCNTHPHNYYLEILTDLGLFGFIIILYLYFYIFFFFYKKYKMSYKKVNYFFLPFACTLIVELFPIRSSGSFFTNSNSTFIFIMISIVVGLIYKKS